MPNVTIILDAHNKCREVEHLIPGLLELARKGSVKVVFTSRHEPPLAKILQSVPKLDMVPADVERDIKAYLEFKVSQSPSPSDPRVHSRVVRILTIKSKGMVLQVVLMLQELGSKPSINGVDDAQSSLPEGLNEAYERILGRLHETSRASQKVLYTKVLRWIALAKRPFRLNQIREALKLEYATSKEELAFAQDLLYSEHDLKSVCGSFVTIKHDIMELVHLSMKEFLVMLSGHSQLYDSVRQFLVDSIEASARIGSLPGNGVASPSSRHSL